MVLQREVVRQPLQKAACYMLLTGKRKHDITIITPKKIEFKASITDINISEKCVSCSVIKDGGDDPDITTGAHITASVTYLDEKSGHKCYNKKKWVSAGDNRWRGVVSEE